MIINVASDEDKKYKLVLYFILQLYKKVLHPLPKLRLKLIEVSEIYKFIFNYIKNVNMNNYVDDLNFVGNFIIEFTKFLKSKSISIEAVFYKNFAFLDFNSICNKNMFEFIKAKF